MPSVHVPEDVFEEYINQTGGYSKAKDRIKTVLREDSGVEG
jgi:hypothetical protein